MEVIILLNHYIKEIDLFVTSWRNKNVACLMSYASSQVRLSNLYCMSSSPRQQMFTSLLPIWRYICVPERADRQTDSRARKIHQQRILLTFGNTSKHMLKSNLNPLNENIHVARSNLKKAIFPTNNQLNRDGKVLLMMGIVECF